MFEDVCLVCGRIADGLYCSDVCRDADSVQLPPSSIDHAIDLGFITDSIPPLVHSQPTNTTSTTNTNTQDPSAVSSPTSSILTTPSLIDDLEPTELEREKEKEKAFDGGVTVTGDSFLLPPPTSVNHNASGGGQQKPPSSPIPPHFHLPTAPPSQVVSPRLQPTTAPLLPFARKPGNTNIHTPPPSTQHHHGHGSSASCSRAHSQAHNHRRTSSFNPVTITPTASPLSPTARGAPHPSTQAQTQISHTQTSSRCSTSGHASPALSPLRGVEEEDLIRKLELAAAAEDANAEGRHAESSIARKRRARQSLPAYFSNLMMNVPRASSSKVPSAAVSSGSSSDERKQQRQPAASASGTTTTGQRIRHVRSKSAMRAADRAKASMTRSSSGVSVGVAEKDKENVYAQSPTTPTVLTRNASRTGVLAYFNAAMNAKADEDVSPPPSRGRDREKARRGAARGTNPSRSGRPINITTSTLNTTNNVAASWVEAIVSPITATRYSTTPPKFVGGDDLPGSFAERHIRFVAGGNAGAAGRGRRAIDVLQGQLVRSPPPTTPVIKSGLPTPPPLAAATTTTMIKDQSPSSPINIRVGSNSSSNTRGGRPRAGMLENDVSVPYLVPAGAAHAQQRLHAHHRYTGPTILGGGKKRVDVLLAAEGGHGGPKSRRYSSPTTSTAGIGSGLHVPVPLALMMSPAIERPGRGMVRGAGRREREEESVPQRPVVRRGWSPVRGRGAAVFDEDDDEEENGDEDGDGAEEADEEEEAEEEEEQTRGRSRSRIRSRSRARSRSVERRRFGGRRSFGVAGY